ncbi:hypothetical protein BDZ91DRAFT_430344 [Kalaharituber pfeilii]|nr:hypothetical protein BDZ91DRAFT_430344 [Kalaharituber pfeilii]
MKWHFLLVSILSSQLANILSGVMLVSLFHTATVPSDRTECCCIRMAAWLLRLLTVNEHSQRT